MVHGEKSANFGCERVALELVWKVDLISSSCPVWMWPHTKGGLKKVWGIIKGPFKLEYILHCMAKFTISIPLSFSLSFLSFSLLFLLYVKNGWGECCLARSHPSSYVKFFICMWMVSDQASFPSTSIYELMQSSLPHPLKTKIPLQLTNCSLFLITLRIIDLYRNYRYIQNHSTRDWSFRKDR